MKRYLFILGLIGIIASSCDKVKELKDEISSYKYNPQLVLNPVDTVSVRYTHCSEPIPFPSDSIQSLEIDIDNDEINDFRFTYSTSFNFVSSMDSCENHNSRIVIEAIGIDNKILVKENASDQVRILGYDELIVNTNLVASSATIFLEDASAPDDITFESGNKYIGVRLSSNRMGWIKFYHDRASFKFTVLQNAYNDNFHLNIKAGQIQ
mgnify:CR=1 FL=1